MKVRMVGYTADLVTSICTAIAIMKEKDPCKFIHSLSSEDSETMIKEILKSRLRGALEFASFEFLLEGVSRTFTHQLVRHRAFHFSQQSMRFFNAGESEFVNPIKEPKNGFYYLRRKSEESLKAYVSAVHENIPIEDARSILPQNIETKIMFGATLRGLIEMAEVRLCYQAQGEFQEAAQLIKEEVSRIFPFIGSLLIPACERSGRCEFKSVYDRPCPKEVK